MRITSDGAAADGVLLVRRDDVPPVGRPAPLSTFANPRIGPVALSDQAPSVPDAYFDWIRFNPERVGGGGGGGGGDSPTSSTARRWRSPPWEVVRQDQNLTVSGGALRIPAAQGDIYGGGDNAKNLVLRDAPDGAWEAATKLNFKGTAQYHQAGMIVYGDDDNFTKFGRIAHTTDGRREVRVHLRERRRRRATTRPTRPPTWRRDFPDDFFLRITSDGTNITGAYSTDGDQLDARRAARAAARRTRGSACSRSPTTAATAPEAAFDSFRLVDRPGAARPARAATTSSTAPRSTRPAGTRSCARTRDRVRGRGRRADDHDRRRATSTPATRPAAEQLHPPVRGPRRRGLGDRDEAIPARSTAATRRAA